MVAQKFNILLEKEKRTVRGYALVAFSYKKRLQCAESKATVYGEWAMQHL